VTTQPLVSVVTVCFNAAATIATTLDSVRAQTWRPLESVVVDGGSTDGTREVVTRYTDITGTVVSGPDGGIYDAMNKGIDLARGEIIHFLNADDCFVDAGVVEAALAIFMAEPDVDLVFGDAIYRSSDGAFLRRFKLVNARNLLYGDLCHQVVFARSRVFECFGRFNPEYRINADYDWMLRVFRGGARVRYLPRAIVYYDAGGLSAANLTFTRAERMRVRLQYTTQSTYRIGELGYRLRRKFLTVLGRLELTPYADS
jgi:glycosyltransferase involved in cell wall biosynthesis